MAKYDLSDVRAEELACPNIGFAFPCDRKSLTAELPS
jgi:hypothetical protein